MSTASSSLLDEDFLRKLDRLSLVAKKARAGTMEGERRSTKRGSSVEFADYRNYVVGDDLRQIDWNIYGRLERLFVKLFEEEEEMSLHILVDASKSMDWGEPDKLDYARKTAAALGYVALSNMDRLSTAALHGETVDMLPPMRGKAEALRYLAFLGELEAGGVTSLNDALRTYSQRGRFPGALILISDLLAPEGFFDGLRDLGGRGYDVSIIHVLSPDEEEPALAGDLQLIDVETGEPCEMSVDSSALEVYRRRLQAWRNEIKSFCHGRRIDYVPVSTALPFEELVLHHLRRRRLIR